ncbi:rod shape-determining protein MreC [Parvularcula marina]|uniref:Cell shape-determining protein MreC n=1 Tax=Parvularcula marina TaxID=2292771 RepID=A0A371RKU2_9PROT|nr:rod shape-determining protein MreC [Parvularcula marina]RFB06065.1 rod shape-determining protein MreC [Parvularcula marina]
MAIFDELKGSLTPKRHPRRTGIVFFLSLSLSMTGLSFYGAQASVFEKARETVLDVFEPVLTAFGAPARWIGNRVGNVEDYFRIYAENKRLREENAELRVWMQDALSLRRQIYYYEQLLETKQPEPATFIDASVIGENNGPYDHALILSAGRTDGVKPGQAVVDDGGLLGHVITSGSSAARILLVTDYESQVPVFIEDLEVEALLAGRSSGMPVLEIFSERRAVPIKPGGRIVTSGADGLLPRGLPVGEVARVVDGVVYVDLFANTRTPDLVRIVDYAFPSDVEDPAPEQSSSLGGAEGPASADG